jgi:hypothetical protein
MVCFRNVSLNTLQKHDDDDDGGDDDDDDGDGDGDDDDDNDDALDLHKLSSLFTNCLQQYTEMPMMVPW